MAGITVTKESLSGILRTTIPDDVYNAVDQATRRIIRTGYRPEIDAAEGHAADVLDSVYTSIALRLLTNPAGARTLGLGSASVTMGGTDEGITSQSSLTDSERADLASLRNVRRPSYVALRKMSEPSLLPPIPEDVILP